jgi:hypothetical protein
MARGMANGEKIVSQAGTDTYRDAYDRIFGKDHQPVRGAWVQDPVTGEMVSADQYVPPVFARDAGVIADRIHEGTTFHDGERVRDLGSRRKRREFLRETGLADATDCSRSWLESQAKSRERAVERKIEQSAEQAARKLYANRKWRE